MQAEVHPPHSWLALFVAAGLIHCGGAPQHDSGARLGSAVSGAAAAHAGPNRAPEIRSFYLTPRDPAAGEPVRAQVEAIDPDGDPITLTYDWTLEGRGLAAGGPEVRAAEARRGDQLALRLTARDPQGLFVTTTREVRIGNRAPRLVGLRIDPPGRVRAGRDIIASPFAEDADGDPLTFRYTWRVNGRLQHGAGATLRTDGLERGDTVEVEVVATDGFDPSERLSSPPIRLVNAPPEVAVAPISNDPDGSFHHTIRATDPDGDRLAFRLAAGPEGMQLDPVLGVLDWTPAPGQVGIHPVRVEVEDRHGGAAELSFELTVDHANPGPPAALQP